MGDAIEEYIFLPGIKEDVYQAAAVVQETELLRRLRAKSGMNPKTLQYLMGHSDISVTMNVYTHIGFDDAEEELKRMEEFRKAQAEIDKKNDAKAISQKMFKVI